MLVVMADTDVLARLPIFADLHPRSMQAVAALAVETSAPAGTELMREGEPADAFYVIVSGTVHIESDGRFVRSMSDGGFLGEIGLVEGAERTATATCRTDCELIRFGSHEFGRMVETFPDVRARITAAVARRPHAGS
jgi:CRP-like cAMP-binding protein